MSWRPTSLSILIWTLSLTSCSEMNGAGGSPASRGYFWASFSSMRRLRRKSASVLPAAKGWNSPKPAATSRFGGTPLLIRYFTTEMAREDDSSQFDRNVDVDIG